MKQHAKQFQSEVYKARDMLTHDELAFLFFSLAGSITAQLEGSKNGEVYLNKLIEGLDYGIQFQLAMRKK